VTNKGQCEQVMSIGSGHEERAFPELREVAQGVGP
jgi:hypothetical protein